MASPDELRAGVRVRIVKTSPTAIDLAYGIGKVGSIVRVMQGLSYPYKVAFGDNDTDAYLAEELEVMGDRDDNAAP